MDMIFALALLLIVALSVVWSVFVRKLAKTRIKSICTIASVVMALIATIVIKTLVIDPAFVKGTLLPLIPSLPAEIMDLINGSDLLLEFVVGLPVALISPLIFVVLFIVFRLLAGLVYLLVLIFAGKAIRKSNKRKIPYAKARSFLWSAAAAVLSLLVILIPVAFYGGFASDVIEIVADMEVVDAGTKDELTSASEEYIQPLANGTTISLFRAIGGDMLIDEMTAFTVEGEVIFLKTELNAIVNLAGNIMPLVKDSDFQNYGEKEAERIEGIVDALTDSKFLTVIASEAVYFLTDGMVSGEEDMPMADNELFGGVVSKLLTVVHDDAKDTDLFVADLKTVAAMVGDLIEGGVLANMDDTDALMDELAGGDTIKNVIRDLGKNTSLKCLIPEFTNIGIKAIANAVEVKENEQVVYDELMSTIAADINSVKGLDDAQKVKDLSPKLTAAFDKAGIPIDKQVIDLYSVAMIQDLINEGGEGDVVAADVQNFFVAYAESAKNVATPAPVEGGETANSAAAVLARLIYNLSAIDVKAESFNQEELAALLATEAEAMLGTTEGALYEKVAGVTIKRNLDSMFADSNEAPQYDYAIQKRFYTTSTFENSKALVDAKAMRERSLLIFMDEVVIDVDNVGDFDPDNEAEAIGGIFSKAGSLMDDLSGEELDIGIMATSVGAILNSLEKSASVGEERTTNLFIAIIQSPMVKDSAAMDIGTATQLGVKGTQKNNDGTPVDYEKTFKIISDTMTVLQKMSTDAESGGGMSEADLAIVLKDMTPQTAGMIESYITEERLQDEYMLDETSSATAAPLISGVFGFMAENEFESEEQYEREAEALNDVMTLVTNASNNTQTTGQTVFGNDPGTSIVGKDATTTVDTFMSSEALKSSLRDSNESGTLGDDPFGLSEMMKEEEGQENQDKTDLVNAMNNHYQASENKDKDKTDLTNIGKLFGFDETFMNTEVFGEEN